MPALQDKAKLRKSYEDDGFMVVKQGMSKKKMNNLRAELTQMFGAYAKPGEDIHATCIRLDKEDKPLLHRMFQMTQKMLVMDDLKFDALPYAKLVLPKGYYATAGIGVLFGLPEDTRLAYNWHQESNYMPNMPHVLNYWFPVFEDATMENGTMSCLVGSHQYGKLPYVKKKAASNSYTDLIPVDVEKYEKKHKEHFFLAKPGDLVMLHHDTIHRSNANMSKHVRFSGILRIAVFDKVPDKMVITAEDY